MLGQGTYKAGRGAIETLAMKYAFLLLTSFTSYLLPLASCFILLTSCFPPLTRYATTVLMRDDDAEVAMFSAAGAEPAGVNYMHATDADSLRDCAGCTVSLRFAIKK